MGDRLGGVVGGDLFEHRLILGERGGELVGFGVGVADLGERCGQLGGVETEQDGLGNEALHRLGVDRHPPAATEAGSGGADVAACAVGSGFGDHRGVASAAADESSGEQVGAGGPARRAGTRTPAPEGAGADPSRWG